MAFSVKPADFKAVISDPTASLCGNFINTLLKLPVLLYTFINELLDSSGDIQEGVIKTITDNVIRPGDLIFSAAPLDEEGRLLCNGQLVSRTTYADLFAAIGETYGAGDATTTFGLPDYRGNFPRGAGTLAVGDTGGSETVTLDLTNIPPHTHGVKLADESAPGTGQFYARTEEATVDTEDHTVDTTSAGGSGSPAAAQPFNVMNPWLACYIYVKV